MLALLVEVIIKQSPLSGHLYVFRNQQCDKIKMLLWDRYGFWIYCRGLERAHFKIPKIMNRCIELSLDDLKLFIDLIDGEKLRRFLSCITPSTYKKSRGCAIDKTHVFYRINDMLSTEIKTRDPDQL